jgi:spore maturation protein CgeB
MIAVLRQSLPNIKIVAVYMDPWEIAPEFVRRMAPDVDAIWTVCPSVPLWRDAIFTNKLLLAPFPNAGNLCPPQQTAPNRISFSGGLMSYNWHRIFWWAASIKSGLPIDWDLSTHINDGKSPLESFANYIRRLTASGCSLCLGMRHDMTCFVTGRAFDTLRAGALLIQEDTPDLDYFMVAGEHCLRFSTFADFRAIFDMLAHQPAVLQRIRHAGHEFAVARYSDEKLIGYLDAILFYS